MKAGVKKVGLISLCLVLFLSLFGFAAAQWAKADQISPEVGEFNHTSPDSLGVGSGFDNVKVVMNYWGFVFDDTVTEGVVSEQAKKIEEKIAAKYEDVGIQENPNSWIKTWDKIILQTFGGGPSDFYGIGSALIYSPFSDDVYYMPLKYMQMRWGSDQKDALGYIASDVLENKTITLSDGTEKTFEEILLFQYGYIYKENDDYTLVTSQLYNKTENCFVEGKTTNYVLNCGEFRNQLCVGASFTIDGITYQNHQRGYVAYNEEKGTYLHRGLQNVTVEGTVVSVPDYFISNDPGGYFAVGKVDTVYDPTGNDGFERVKSMVESYGKTFDAATLQQKYIDKFNEIHTADYCVGIPRSWVKVWDGMILQEYWWGDGMDLGTLPAGKNLPDNNFLVYNPETEQVYLLNDVNVYNAWMDNKLKGLGFLVSDMKENCTVTDQGTDLQFEKVQFFTGGYVYSDNGTWKTVLGKKYDAENDTLIPVLNFQCGVGEFGSPVGAPIEIKNGENTVYYQNYNRGYMYTEDKVYYEYVALRNVDENGNISFVADSWITDLAGKFSTDASGEAALSTIQSAFEAKEKTFDQDALGKAFKDKALELARNGYSVGVLASWVKVWNGVVIQDFANGDGNFSWAHGTNYVTTQGGKVRSRVTSLVYNIDKGEVFAMTGDSLNYFAWNSSRLGQLESDLIEVTNFKMPGETNARTVAVQQFEKGLVWYGDNLGHVVYGGRYDATTGEVSYIPSPFVPGEYGAQIGDAIKKDGVWYLNYQNGCIEAKMNFNNTELDYIYHTARMYDTETNQLSGLRDEVKPYLLGLIDNAVATASNTPNLYAERLKAKYNEMWDKGICAGLIDGRGYVDWCNTMGIQFYFADSVAEISPNNKDNRKQIAWWVDDATAGKVYVIDNNMLNAWLYLNSYNTYGAPKGDVVYETNGDSHILCSKGTLVLADDNWMSAAFVEGGTYQDYLDSKTKKDEPEFDGEKGGCGSNMTGVSIAFGTVAIVVAAAVAVCKKKEG